MYWSEIFTEFKMQTVQVFKRSVLTLILTTLVLGACTKRRPEQKLPAIEPAERIKIHKNLIKSWDTNNDGSATCDDILETRALLFNQLDANKDGALRKGEYRLAAFEDKSFVFIDFDKADIDLSGQIDRAEFIAIPHRSFQGIDRDSNCLLDEEEAIFATLSDRSRLGIRGQEDKKKERSRRGGKIDDIDG